MSRFDLVVIGGGSAGLTAARTAVRLGASVLLVERDRLGGDCLWAGCVPSKALLHVAAQVRAAGQAGRFGLSVTGTTDLAAAMSAVAGAQGAIAPGDSAETLGRDGIQVRIGAARFTGPRSLSVGQEQVDFRFAVIATGSVPALVPIPGLAEAGPLTSDTVWRLRELPDRLVVLGGGPVGCELGQAFARLGSRVTIVEVAERLLPREELAASAVIQRVLASEGVEILTGFRADAVTDNAVVGADRELRYDRLLAVTGRRPVTAQLDLAAAGVALDGDGYVRVDGRLRTANPRIYAAGDVTGRSAFTHLGGVQGAAAAIDALLGVRRRIDYDAVPAVTFTDPEVARVGPTAAEARSRLGNRVTTRTVGNEDIDRAVADGGAEGFTALVLSPRGRIVGATVVSPRAGETIAHLAAAVRHRWTASQYAATIHPYPTYADGPWNAALAEVYDGLSADRRAEALLRLRRRWAR